jgi:hypothetical protein
MSQVGGLVLIQQQLERLSMHLHTLHELLVGDVEEKRSPEAALAPLRTLQMHCWRLTTNAKLLR